MKIKTAHLILTGALAGGALVMTSCSSVDSHGHVYRDWSKRMSEMGIFPVYPPREDIVVGDVYALPLHPYDTAAVGYIGGLGNAGIHVDYLGDKNLGWSSLLKAEEKYYQGRPYPADSTDALISGTNIALTRIPGYPDALTNRRSAFSTGSVARLRQVSFPDFNISHIDQQSLSAVIPIEGIMAGLNFNRSDITGVHFSIPHAESYGLTIEELLRQLFKEGHFRQSKGTNYVRADQEGVISVGGAQMAYGMFADIMKNMLNTPPFRRGIPWDIKTHIRESAEAMKDRIYLSLISEVYFARSMDITIERKTATGASGSARPISAAELGKLQDMGLLKAHTLTNTVTTTTTTTNAANSSGSSTNVFTGTKAEMIDVTEGDSALDLAKKLREVETPDGVDKIGASVRVLGVSASSIGLRRTFERPIVVGVRGVIVKVDVNHPAYTGSTTGSTNWLRIVGEGSPKEAFKIE